MSGLCLRGLRRMDYEPCVEAMRRFTRTRDTGTPDEIWLVEHPSVYTLGIGADSAHILDAGDIPVVRTDRGGQVTWHGPGQVLVYTLIDIARLRMGVKSFVAALEQAAIDFLADAGITAERRAGAPGVYVAGAKIAALGLRVRHGRAWHGLACNVTNDLAPFTRIDPCGFRGLPVTRLVDLAAGHPDLAHTGEGIARRLARTLGHEWMEP